MVAQFFLERKPLRVRIQNSASDLTLISYTKSDKLLDIQADTKTYWCEEGADGLYQIRFGDDKVGKKLATGNIVIVDYIVSNASSANFAKTFTLSSAVSAFLTADSDAASFIFQRLYDHSFLAPQQYKLLSIESLSPVCAEKQSYTTVSPLSTTISAPVTCLDTSESK